MKFGDHAIGTITRFDDKGRGVFDVTLQDGKARAFLIPFTTIGDTVEASFIKRQEGCFIGELKNLITPGPSRRQTPNPKSQTPNPGMLWAHINYEDQLVFKRDMINRAFADAGHEERVDSIIPFPAEHFTTLTYKGADHGAQGAAKISAPRDPRSAPLFYRNRMDYVFGWKGELGLKEYGSWNRYIDLKNCVLLSPDAPKILDVFRAFMKAHPELKPWDAKKHEGDLRYVVIREGKNTGERLIALIVKDLARITDAAREELVRELDTFAQNIVLAENPALTDLSFGRTIVPLKGKETFDEIINGTRYTIQLNSFFQTSPVMAAKLQDVVAEMVSHALRSTPHAPLLDLYCGLGFFAINLAQRFPNIRASGFEMYQHMIDLAKENARQNNVADQCEFTGGAAEELAWKDIEADTVIVDPPRAGLHHKVIETLLAKAPKTIIYVSCDYHHLVRELTTFKTAYKITELKALDLFPHTPHVEVVVKMEKR